MLSAPLLRSAYRRQHAQHTTVAMHLGWFHTQKQEKQNDGNSQNPSLLSALFAGITPALTSSSHPMKAMFWTAAEIQHWQKYRHHAFSQSNHLLRLTAWPTITATSFSVHTPHHSSHHKKHLGAARHQLATVNHACQINEPSTQCSSVGNFFIGSPQQCFVKTTTTTATSQPILRLQQHATIISARAYANATKDQLSPDEQPLLKKINSTTSMTRLHALLQQYHGSRELDSIAVSAATAHLAHLINGPADGVPPELMTNLHELCTNFLHTFNRRGLINVLWGWATLRDRGSVRQQQAVSGLCTTEWLSQVCDNCVQHTIALTAKELSTLALSLVKLDCRHENLLHAMWDVVPSRLTEFEPQDLATIAWAHAKLGYKNVEFLNKLAPHIMSKLPEFTTQDFSNVAWAYATVGHRDDRLLAELAEVAIPRLPSFAPQTLAIIARAYNSLNAYNTSLFTALSNVATPKLHQFRPQGIANLTLAFAGIGHHDPDFLSALSIALPAQLPAFKRQDLVGTLLSFAILNYDSSSFLPAVASTIHSIGLRNFNNSDLCNILWFLAVRCSDGLPMVHAQLLGDLLREVELRWRLRGSEKFLLQSQQRLFQVYLQFRQHRVFADARTRLSNDCLSTCHQAWFTSLAERTASSQLLTGEKSVPAASSQQPSMVSEHAASSQPLPGVLPELQKLSNEWGWTFAESVTSNDGKVLVDAVLTSTCGAKIAVMVYDRADTTRTFPYRPLGSAALLGRCVRERYAHVVNVWWHEWEEVVGNRAAGEAGADCRALLASLMPQQLVPK